jgi:cytidyltransferase-like protein
MDGKHAIKALYIKTLKGIGESQYPELNEDERAMLEKNGERYVLKEEFRNRIKVVLVGGVFDLLHAGHIFFLNKAKELGDVLIVSVGRDDHIRRKGREPLHGLDERVEILNNLRMVDLAIPGTERIKSEKDYLGILRIVNPDIVAFGYDQKVIPGIDSAKVRIISQSYKPHLLKTSKIIIHRAVAHNNKEKLKR